MSEDAKIDLGKNMRIFDLHVDQLRGAAETQDEVLLVRLRFMSDDIEKMIERLKSDPDLAVALVNNLSAVMQQIDTQAGKVEMAHETIQTARSWALLLPDTTVNE